MYCCTPKALYNHVGGGVSPQPPPVVPAPAEFLSITPAPVICVFFFKYSNVVYNVGASGSRSQYAEYLNLFWKRVHFHDHTRTLCKGSTSSSDTCQSAQDLSSSTYSSMLLSGISHYSRPLRSALLACRVANAFPQNWATFKLLPWLDFPKWNIA